MVTYAISECAYLKIKCNQNDLQCDVIPCIFKIISVFDCATGLVNVVI